MRPQSRDRDIFVLENIKVSVRIEHNSFHRQLMP
jgi:hypothetical protein